MLSAVFTLEVAGVLLSMLVLSLKASVNGDDPVSTAEMNVPGSGLTSLANFYRRRHPLYGVRCTYIVHRIPRTRAITCTEAEEG